AEARERLRVTTLLERRDGDHLGRGDDALAAPPVYPNLQHRRSRWLPVPETRTPDRAALEPCQAETGRACIRRAFDRASPVARIDRVVHARAHVRQQVDRPLDAGMPLLEGDLG